MNADCDSNKITIDVFTASGSNAHHVAMSIIDYFFQFHIMPELDVVGGDVVTDHLRCFEGQYIIPECQLAHDHRDRDLACVQHLSQFHADQSATDNDGFLATACLRLHFLKIGIAVKGMHAIELFARHARQV